MNNIKVIDANKKKFVDGHGRHIHKLRVQLTDACNFRCFYCLPTNIKFMPNNQLLRAKEIVNIVSGLVSLGIDEIRVSGGEPTLRKDIDEIIRDLSNLPISKLGLTTNGLYLGDKLAFLKDTKCQNINISLDSLHPKKFTNITQNKEFNQIYQNIMNAKEMGFNVKINVVSIKGVNDSELFDFIEFSAKYNIEVRFLEYMRIGPMQKKHKDFFIPAQVLINRIKEKYTMIKLDTHLDSTSFNYRLSNNAQIGFIASESKPFCSNCSRLRLTSTGKLRACLMSERGEDMRYTPKEDYPEVVKRVMQLKPTQRIEYIKQPMNQIGG